MSIRLGDTAPDFEAETTQGPIRFHEWIGDSWAILFSHPKDFTPVCTTELGAMAKVQAEFAARSVKVLGLSVDPIEDHARWVMDIEETQGARPNFPLLGDPRLEVAKLYDMLPADAGHSSEGRTAATNATVRSVFVIDPSKKVRLILTYPMTTGRNFDEILRVVTSMQLTSKYQVATPANWLPGSDVIVVPSVSTEDARAKFPKGVTVIKPYLRTTPDPSH